MDTKKQPTPSQDQLLEKYIRESRQMKRARSEEDQQGQTTAIRNDERAMLLPPRSPASRNYRWVAGEVIGAAAGLALALTTQVLGYANLPGVPFYLPPFGSLFNIFLITIMGALFGLACAVSAGSVKKLGWACLAGAVLTEVYFLLSNGVGIWFPLLNIARIFVLSLLIIPLTMGTSFVISAQCDWRNLSIFHWRRASGILALIAISGIIGLFMTLSPEIRQTMRYVNGIIVRGQSAQSLEELPIQLLEPYVQDFKVRGDGRYTIQWDSELSSPYAYEDPRVIGVQAARESFIIRFENGYVIYCSELHYQAGVETFCYSIDEQGYQGPLAQTK